MVLRLQGGLSRVDGGRKGWSSGSEHSMLKVRGLVGYDDDSSCLGFKLSLGFC